MRDKLKRFVYEMTDGYDPLYMVAFVLACIVFVMMVGVFVWNLVSWSEFWIFP